MAGTFVDVFRTIGAGVAHRAADVSLTICACVARPEVAGETGAVV